MKMSSRWSVMACLAVAALGCSDPVGPAKQGAFNARVTAASPLPAGKRCPNTAFPYFEVPAVPTNTTSDERLDDQTYLHWAVDGEGASVSCSVKGQGASIEGRISSGSKTLEISSGTLDATLKGTARITLMNGSEISGSLSSPAADCVLNASNAGGTRYEVAPGRIWATFTCKSVEQQPSDYCAASGTFVLENCDK
jgi:hypothetical protein